METKIIMIIDDDEDDRFFFCSAVKKVYPSYICEQAQNGKEALEKLRDNFKLPDYIFLDLNMPVMNGSDCLRELKSDQVLKNIPVVIFTTSMYPPDVEFMRELGAAYFMIKPLDLTTLPDELVMAMKVVSLSTV
ncbi:MAG: response regulator [Bacteroidetes bacterium]|nr:response regulator [Bacteroidota bacterium]